MEELKAKLEDLQAQIEATEKSIEDNQLNAEQLSKVLNQLCNEHFEVAQKLNEQEAA